MGPTREVELENDLYYARSTINALVHSNKMLNEMYSDYHDLVAERDRLERNVRYLNKNVNDHVEARRKTMEDYQMLEEDLRSKWATFHEVFNRMHLIIFLTYSALFAWAMLNAHK